ncbi:MAG: DUF2115 domain-containing protein [Methanofollis sp.]|uniref:DUF2115 domain-containing protein n=1 Tax=Methanofollis sp. TaxID=2052835 RepID=UPI002611DF32|nr:DUF2115 domain-containing protein [Methanofollis sp.]MDD4256019.1 DUF2115 domain-containing protein [Methanofollis sp.]
MKSFVSAWLSGIVEREDVTHAVGGTELSLMWEEVLAPAGRERGRAAVTPGEIEATCTALGAALTEADLLATIAGSLALYSITDIEAMMRNFEKKTETLDPAYRRRLIPKVREETVGAYHDLLLLCRDGTVPEGPVAADLPAYAAMVAAACRTRVQAGKAVDLFFLKYLLAAFTMYVRGRPAHPVGTPFPGGLEVYEEGGEYYCPVREKEGDVPYSLCPFCPARQDTGSRALHGAGAEERIEKRGFIEESRRNYHG